MLFVKVAVLYIGVHVCVTWLFRKRRKQGSEPSTMGARHLISMEKFIRTITIVTEQYKIQGA